MGRKALFVASFGVVGLAWAVMASAAPRHEADATFDAVAAQHARTMFEEGKKTFRYDTFGSEAFWGDALQLHKAIAGEKNGGVGPGVSPKAALSVGLKVDADALPNALKKQIAAGSQSRRSRDDDSLAQAECGGRSYSLREPGWQRQVDGHPVRVLSLDSRQFVRARDWQAA